MAKLNGVTRIIALVAVGLLVVAALLLMRDGTDKRYVTALFPRTVSLYEGSDVKILGVSVGQVETVEPAGTAVKVRFWYDAKHKVPADADVVLIAPAIVGDRFLQMTPAYTGGDELANNAELGLDRTEVPLELDQIYQNIDDLMVALGPEGANKDGALSRLLDTTASNFAGNGAQFRESIENLGRLTSTLEANKDNLFGAAREIERFVSALQRNDQTVRDFNDSLAAASGVLEDERDDLRAALANLGVAMREVSTFVRDNKEALSKNIKGLNTISKVLVKQRDALDEILTVAPQALDNLYHTYNPTAGTLDTRANLGENLADVTTRPDVVLCGLLGQVDGSGQICNLLTGALGRAAALNKSHANDVVVVEHIDKTLGGVIPGGTS
ncbi:MAG TPA: MCE family protein [Nocardioidaceae bacterium]|nr:MCE family protein [Nocardioidaceae bacterium]